ncbi:MAG: DUF3850 domain-containing protein [Oscillospiraceae bacterium]
MLHKVKILPEYFNAMAEGRKSFEVRKDDRPYKVGDTMLLEEWLPPPDNKYTGRWISGDILLKLKNEYCRDGYCILSIFPTAMHGVMLSNEQNIRTMTTEQLATFLLGLEFDYDVNFLTHNLTEAKKPAKETVMQWLRSPTVGSTVREEDCNAKDSQ